MYQGQNKPVHWYRLGSSWLTTRPSENDQAVRMNSWLSRFERVYFHCEWDKQYTGPRKTNCGIKIMINYYLLQLEPSKAALGICVQFCVQVQVRCWKTGKYSVEEHHASEVPACQRKLRELVYSVCWRKS